MKYWKSTCIGVATSVLVSSAVAGDVSLFNGKDLTGWKIECLEPDKGKAYWFVKDGAITVDTKGDKKHAYVWLVHQTEYKDFDLTLKIRQPRFAVGNSGVQIRSRYGPHPKSPENKDTGWLDGPQIDVHPPAPYRVGLIYDETWEVKRWINPSMKNWKIAPSDTSHIWKWYGLDKDGARVLLHHDDYQSTAADKGAVEAGWNTLRIRAVGTKVETWLNGMQVSNFDGKGTLDDQFHVKRKVGLSGHIALQLHARDDLALQFKDLKLVVLE